eukprot:TRINITY_DN2327_c0_g1_i2.p1 TRINITY_DN2327_c0_g1~~TRINITY_DN2327_c0_g1_i2.p1  ORF type:complete len:279 (-),score=37.88 TRINITY_DN2327_c0_g1_i2:154-990(-)
MSVVQDLPTTEPEETNTPEDHEVSSILSPYFCSQQVTLNIGGTKYDTTKQTLLSKESTFFAGLLQFPGNQDKVYFFIDRDGEWFAPILSYFRTGELYIPSHMPISRVLCEANFYGITLPFSSCVENETLGEWIDDAWLEHRKVKQAFERIQSLGETKELLTLILSEFKECADEGVPIKFTLLNHRERFVSELRSTTPQSLWKDSRWGISQMITKVCCAKHIIAPHLVNFLESLEVAVIIDYCAMKNLTLTITPVLIKDRVFGYSIEHGSESKYGNNCI